jgi:hypothetical protein
VLLALAEWFNLPTHYFAPDAGARLVADPRETCRGPCHRHLDRGTRRPDARRRPESRRTAPPAARRHEELETYRDRASLDTTSQIQRPMPFQEVRDFFYDRKNYIGELDRAAENRFLHHGMNVGGLDTR